MSVLLLPEAYYPTQPADYARSVSEAAAPELYARLVGAWAPCAGRTGAQWDDLRGRGAHGVFTAIDANTDWVPSRLSMVPGNWVQLTSGADYVEIPAAAHLANLFDGGASVVVASRMQTWGDSFPAFVSKQNAGATAGWVLFGFNNAAEAQLRFRCEWTSDGLWRTGNGVVSLTAPQVYGVNYNSAVTTAPTIYVDGVLQALTAVSTPSGSRGDDSATPIRVGYTNTFNDFVGEVGLLLLLKPALETAELQALCLDPLLPLRRRARVWLRPSAAPPAGGQAPRAMHQYRLRR